MGGILDENGFWAKDRPKTVLYKYLKIILSQLTHFY
jgi:hypothetical protein